MSDYFGYKDKVAVVTGAASGMGKALSEILVDLGAKVYALDRVEPPVEGLTKSIIADLGSKESIDSAFAELPESIDAYFGVAGVSGVHNSFIETITVNFIANKYVSDTYLKDRVTQNGSITYVTSNGGLRWEIPVVKDEAETLIHGTSWDDSVAIAQAFDTRIGDVPGSLGYVLSKRMLNLWIAEQVVPFAEARKVRVNAVLPAMTISGMFDEFAEMKGGRAAVDADLGPGGRLAESVDMGRVLAFLGSDLAGYVSGAHLSVDFGANSQQLIGTYPDRGRFSVEAALSARQSA